MDIITNKKFSLRNVPFISLYGRSVCLVDDDEESLSVYEYKLKSVDIKVLPYKHLKDLLSDHMSSETEVVILNPLINNTLYDLRWIEKLKQFYSPKPILTISKGMQDSQLDAIMTIGVNYHINRDLAGPQDLLIALEQLVRN